MANSNKKVQWAMSKKITILLFFLSNFICLYSQNISDEFRQDTARVEQKVRDMLDKDDSTFGMLEANKTLEIEYDKLLNKYYKILYNKLDENGKKALKETQLNWIKFRDAEKNFVAELRRNTLDKMGGGTIWGVIYGNLSAQITRERVFVLYNYLVSDN
ncbi:MAG: DUF1311 domain-containing protein [Candidatus Azobacteroides sp.]|nr:DUF1311 domain-containing protein [Candidatus Azobacteroides sp.]